MSETNALPDMKLELPRLTFTNINRAEKEMKTRKMSYLDFLLRLKEQMPLNILDTVFIDCLIVLKLIPIRRP